MQNSSGAHTYIQMQKKQINLQKRQLGVVTHVRAFDVKKTSPTPVHTKAVVTVNRNNQRNLVKTNTIPVTNPVVQTPPSAPVHTYTPNPTTVLVRNLKTDMSATQIMMDIFGEDGQVNEVTLYMSDPSKSAGFAEFTFAYKEEAEQAVAKRQGLIYCGRPLYITIIAKQEAKSVPVESPAQPIPVTPAIKKDTKNVVDNNSNSKRKTTDVPEVVQFMVKGLGNKKKKTEEKKNTAVDIPKIVTNTSVTLHSSSRKVVITGIVPMPKQPGGNNNKQKNKKRK